MLDFDSSYPKNPCVKNEGHLQFCVKNEEGIGDIYKGCGIYIGDAG